MANKQTHVAWLATIGLICFSFLIGSWLCVPISRQPTLRAQDTQQSTPSGLVSISGNTALDAFTPKTGSGTAVDPYVIQNLEIASGATAVLFNLGSTTKHLIVRKCTFTSTDTTACSGIQLSAAGNVTVENCTFKGFRSASNIYMIYAMTSDMITIRNNLFENGAASTADTIYGIDLFGCDDCVVSGNTVRGMRSDGVVPYIFSNCNRISMTGNTGQNCTGEVSVTGIQFSNVRDSVVRGNSFRDLKGDTYAYGARFITGFNNSRFESNNYFGVEGLTEASGIYIEKISDAAFIQNKIEDVSIQGLSYGIYVGNSLSENLTFSQNIIASGEVPMFLRGTSHVLYDTAWHPPTAQYRYLGNYYSNYTGADANEDYIGDTPANCGSGIMDPYPILYGGLDVDGDGLYNAEELGTYHTDPNLADTDGDDWSDAYEIRISGTNPLSMDSDGDGKIDSEDTTPGYADPEVTVIDLSVPIYAAAGIIGASLIFFGIMILIASRKGPKGQGRTASDKA